MKWADKIDMKESGRASASAVAALSRGGRGFPVAAARFRRRASLVDAVLLDGSEAALRSVLAIPGATIAVRPDGIEIVTEFGRRRALTGQWISCDRATGTLRVEDASDFAADYEPV